MTSWNGNIFRVTGHLCGEFPVQRPVTWSFDVFFDLRLNKRLCKQSWGWWFETPSRPLWRHRNDKVRPGIDALAMVEAKIRQEKQRNIEMFAENKSRYLMIL